VQKRGWVQEKAVGFRRRVRFRESGRVRFREGFGSGKGSVQGKGWVHVNGLIGFSAGWVGFRSPWGHNVPAEEFVGF
jgi:hypothetical protein